MSVFFDKTECALLLEDKEVRKRILGIGEDFQFQVTEYDSSEHFLDKERNSRIIVVGSNEEKIEKISAEITEKVQACVFHCPDAVVVAVINREIESKDLIFLQKSGAGFVTSKDNALKTSRMDFYIIQKIKAEYFPIKEQDLMPDEHLTFDLFYMMPKNMKYLRVVKKGGFYEEKKVQKFRELGELYVHRSQVHDYAQFAKDAANSRTDDDPLRKYRAIYLDHYVKFADFIVQQTEPVQNPSYGSGKALLETYFELSRTLIADFEGLSLDHILGLINQSQVGEFGSVERAVSCALFTAYFSLKMDLEQKEEVVLFTLVSFFGQLAISHEINRKVRAHLEDEFNREERQEYRNFPLKTIDLILTQKVPLNEKQRELILTALERADGSGIPNGKTAEHLSIESQLIGFSIYFDSKVQIKMGEVRPKGREILEEIVEEAMHGKRWFTNGFLGEIRKVI